MRSLVLTSALLLGSMFAAAQTAPPAQQSPSSQIPGEPGTPMPEQRPGTPATAPRTQLPPEQPQAQKPEEPAPPSSGEQQRASDSTPVTIEGCLNAMNGSFEVTDESRGKFQLIGAAQKLSGEVGHTVQVTGTASSTAAPQNQPSGVSANSQAEVNETTPPATNPTADSGQQMLHVSTVKVLSQTCNDVPQR